MKERPIERLRRLIEEAGGNVREGVRRFSGLTLADLAEEAGLSREQVNLTLGCYPGRRGPHIRRQIELYLGLEPYDLDGILDPIHADRRRAV